MRRGLIGMAVGFLLLAISPAEFGRAAAQGVTGDLQGLVVAEDGQPLSDAQVTISAPGVRERTLLTDRNGRFRVLALPPAAYELRITLIGRETVELKDQPVRLGQTTGLGRIAMRPNPVALAGVTVSATRPQLDPLSTTYGAHLTRSAFENMPIERDYQTLAAILPHVSPDITGMGLDFAGGTGLENQFYVEGMNVSEPLNGSGGMRLPYNFVKELEVRTGSYDAEYRGALGGIMNVVTASGTNELAVDAFGFYTDRRFNEAPRFGSTLHRGDYALYDVGATVSGPVLRDRVWFFAAWNPTFEREQVPLPGLGRNETDLAVTHRFAGKLNWQPTPQTRVELTSVGDPYNRNAVGSTYINYGGLPGTLVNPDPYLSSIRHGNASVSLRASHLPNERILIETWLTRAAFSEVHVPRGGSSSDPFFIDMTTPGGTTWSGRYGEDVKVASTRTSGAAKVRLALGTHELKLGGEVESVGTGGHESELMLRRVSADRYHQYQFRSRGTVRARALGLYVQESWALTPRLHLNPGLRYGHEWQYDSEGKLAIELGREWQPRLSAVYETGAHGKASASFGRYYQAMHTAAATAYFTRGVLCCTTDWDHDPRIDPSGAEGSPGIDEASTAEALRFQGQHFDEWTLGYEHLLGARAKASVRGIQRTLRQAIEDGLNADQSGFVLGNPGSGPLSEYPRALRRYSALELSLEGAGERGYVLASYVLSRNYGNYTGLLETDDNYPFPNFSGGFDNPESLANATGLLPNDRTHVFKTAGWYRLRRLPMNLGATFVWQSGTPLSEFGITPSDFGTPAFVRQRGTAGRTPATRDLSLRGTYLLPGLRSGVRPVLMLDLFHVFSGQAVTAYDQFHYRVNTEGVFSDPSDTYMQPTRYALPMSARLGMSVSF